jgi:hypothetical protein
MQSLIKAFFWGCCLLILSHTNTWGFEFIVEPEIGWQSFSSFYGTNPVTLLQIQDPYSYNGPILGLRLQFPIVTIFKYALECQYLPLLIWPSQTGMNQEVVGHIKSSSEVRATILFGVVVSDFHFWLGFNLIDNVRRNLFDNPGKISSYRYYGSGLRVAVGYAVLESLSINAEYNYLGVNDYQIASGSQSIDYNPDSLSSSSLITTLSFPIFLDL